MEQMISNLWTVEHPKITARLEAIKKQMLLIEAAYKEVELDSHKGYQHYTQELRLTPQRRENTLREMDADILRLETRLRTLKEKRQAELEKSEQLEKFYQQQIESIKEKAKTPQTTAYKKLRAERALVEDELKALQDKITAATKHLTETLLPSNERRMEAARKEREEMERRKEQMALEEGRRAWEERMARENAEQAARQRARDAAAGILPTPPPVPTPPPSGIQNAAPPKPAVAPKLLTNMKFKIKPKPATPPPGLEPPKEVVAVQNPFWGKSSEELSRLMSSITTEEDSELFMKAWTAAQAAARGMSYSE